MFNKITTYYAKGLRTKKMVGDAVKNKKITEEEYKIITGDDYEVVADTSDEV